MLMAMATSPACPGWAMGRTEGLEMLLGWIIPECVMVGYSSFSLKAHAFQIIRPACRKLDGQADDIDWGGVVHFRSSVDFDKGLMKCVRAFIKLHIKSSFADIDRSIVVISP
jgi:hypothetical protein